MTLSSKPPSSVRRRIVRFALFSALIVGGLLSARILFVFRDRHPNHSVLLDIPGRNPSQPSQPLRAGFARLKINPDVSNPRKPVWLAGFSQNRAATKIHDDLWAVAIVIDDGQSRLGLVALDAIGFFHDDVIEVRRSLSKIARLTYAIVCSTHNHSTPDLMGLWGPHPLKSGVNPAYRLQVIAAAAKALEEATANLQPAEFSSHEIELKPDGLQTDTRKPRVFDPNLRFLHFKNPTNNATLGSLVGWANHPETVWSGDTEITADFPGTLRDALESGIHDASGTKMDGLGGIHVFVNGAVGGLMTTHPSVTVPDPYQALAYTKPSHEKTRALGQSLAKHILTRLKTTNAPSLSSAPLSIRARTIQIRLDNPGFLIAPVLGLIDRGHQRWNHIRTETALITLGNVSFACIPGEIYPELVNGGMEQAPGGDFGIPPLEVPPIRELMPGQIKFVLGLANDAIGYIIPKSEWDRRPPFLYGAQKAPYGEVNSVGPETAQILHRTLSEMCRAATSN